MATAPVIDEELYKKVRTQFGSGNQVKKSDLVLYVAQRLQLDAKRETSATGYIPLNPFNDWGGTRTNDAYDVIAKAIDLLPDEFKRSGPTGNGGTAYAIDLLYLRPFFQALIDSGELNENMTEGAQKAIDTVNVINDFDIQSYYAQRYNLPQTDPRVEAAVQARRNDMTSTASLSFSFTAQPETAPSEPTTEIQADTAPASEITVDPSLPFSEQTLNLDTLSAGYGKELPPGVTTEQEYLQTFPDAGLADVLSYFADYSVDMAGMALTGGIYSDSNGTMMSGATASAYPYSLKTKDQVANLQETLRKAGYFDMLGQQPAIGRVDTATKMAWDLAMLDSTRFGVTVAEHLDERVKNYSRELGASKGVVYADADALYLSARNFGMELIGRGLTQNELDSFVSYIRKWENEASLDKSFSQDNYEVEMSAKAQTYFENRYANDVAMSDLDEWWKTAPKLKREAQNG